MVFFFIEIREESPKAQQNTLLQQLLIIKITVMINYLKFLSSVNFLIKKCAYKKIS